MDASGDAGDRDDGGSVMLPESLEGDARGQLPAVHGAGGDGSHTVSAGLDDGLFKPRAVVKLSLPIRAVLGEHMAHRSGFLGQYGDDAQIPVPGRPDGTVL